MRVILDEPTHTILEVEGLELVIHGLSGDPEVHRHEDGPVPIREDSYFKLCLPVESIAAVRSLAATHGGTIKSQEYEWEARGFRACDGHDPEGNVIQVRENAV